MQLMFKERGVVSGAEWAKIVPEMYVWVDFMSMAQPGAGKMPWDKKAATAEAGDAGEGKGEQKSEDHRQSEENKEAVECLNDGVESLPGYVELSDLILVLVPTMGHQNRAGEVCDFPSWRGRGWCRLEYLATVLSPAKNRVLVVRGGGH